VGFASYGSGCSAKVFSGVFAEEYKQVSQSIRLFEKLDTRKRISFDDYVRLHESKPGSGDSILQPQNEYAIVKVGRGETDFGFRYYKYV